MNERKKLIEMLYQWGNNENDGIRAESIADYLLANGIIIPIFTIGDTVWIRDMHDNISSHKINGVDIMTNEFVKPIFQYYYQDDIDYRKLHMFTNEDIGKVAFFTEEEAKNKCKRRENKNE